MLTPNMPVAIIRAIESSRAEGAAVGLLCCMPGLVMTLDILLFDRLVWAALDRARVTDYLRVVLAGDVAVAILDSIRTFEDLAALSAIFR